MRLPWFGAHKPDTTNEPEDNQASAVLDETDDDDELEFDEEEDELDTVIQKVQSWGEEWFATGAFTSLTEEQQNEAAFVISSFTEYMYRYHDAAPEQWTVADMEECCLSTLPQKISTDEAYFRAIAPVLASFFSFLGRTGRIPRADRLIRRIQGLDSKIVAASQDPRNWGMAKSFVMAAQNAGVDITNDDEMNEFTSAYNEQLAGHFPMIPNADAFAEPAPAIAPPQEPFIRSGPKVGRNDPCPCGSGKKYKKCCGSA